MLAYTFLIIVGLMAVSYRIRNIPEEFSMTRELAVIKIIMIFQVFVYIFIVMIIYEKKTFDYKNAILDDLGDNPILSHSNYLYIISAFHFLIMIESGVLILRQTYKPNDIVPFPISMNVITSFQQAIVMPLPTNHFYMYLEDLPNYEEALIIFGLHADISIYNKMVEEMDEPESFEAAKQKAVEIFEDYITENCQFRVD